MRVLFVTNRFPGQSTRGDQLRAYSHIVHLAQRHAITLLSFAAPDVEDASTAQIRASCKRVIIVRPNRLSMVWRACRAFFQEQALQVAMFDAAPKGLVDVLAEGQFDLAHVQLVRLAPLRERLAPLPCVYDLVDALSLNMARRAAVDRGLMAFIARREVAPLARLEHELCQNAAAVAVCSPADRLAIGDDRLQLVGNGVDLQRFPFVADRLMSNDLVFVGNLGYFPNVDAATWFAQQVLPLLRAQIPDLRLRLVGARPAPSLVRLAEQTPNVELVGPVADVHPHLAQAAVAVVPMRAGSGQQLKMLEAMASGTPVVASAVSAAGLSAVDGEHFLVANDPRAFADAIVRLLRDTALRSKLSQAARVLVEQHYSWDASARDLEQLWLAAANKNSAKQIGQIGRRPM